MKTASLQQPTVSNMSKFILNYSANVHSNHPGHLIVHTMLFPQPTIPTLFFHVPDETKRKQQQKPQILVDQIS